MAIAVPGSSGFIGTAICRLLTSVGQPFRIVDQKPSPVFGDGVQVADIRDIAALRQAVSGDCILHLAAVHRDDVRPVSLYDDINVQGTRNICAVAVEKGINRIVFASSVAIYGFAPAGTD